MTFMCEYNVRKRLTVWNSYFKPDKSNKRKNSKYSNMKDQIQPTHNYVLRIQNSKGNPPFITTTKSTSTTERVTLKTSNPTTVTTTLLDLISDQKICLILACTFNSYCCFGHECTWECHPSVPVGVRRLEVAQHGTDELVSRVHHWVTLLVTYVV